MTYLLTSSAIITLLLLSTYCAILMPSPKAFLSLCSAIALKLALVSSLLFLIQCSPTSPIENPYTCKTMNDSLSYIPTHTKELKKVFALVYAEGDTTKVYEVHDPFFLKYLPTHDGTVLYITKSELEAFQGPLYQGYYEYHVKEVCFR